MDKAFDLKDLSKRLEAQGLPAIEKLAEIALEETSQWAQESCLQSSNDLVKAIGVPVINIMKPLVKSMIDKIDGEPG